MMRKLFYLLFLATAVLFGQNDKSFTARQVAKLPVFPGCESFENEGSQALQKCMSGTLSNLLADKLENYTDLMEARGITDSQTKLQFIIANTGKITSIKTPENPANDPELSREAVKALEEIANELAPIKPAELDDGTKVNIAFQLPLRYKLEDDTPNYIEKGVIVTMQGENENYEVVFDAPNKTYTVYAVTDDHRSFLGNFNSVNEILLLQPYTSLNPYLGDKILITEGKLENKKYRMWLNKSYGDIVEIYDITDGSESLITTLPMGELYQDDFYSQLIRR